MGSKIYIYLCCICITQDTRTQHQRKRSHYFEQDTIINAVHHVTLGKANINADNIAKVWDIWNQTILPLVAFKGGEDIDNCSPSSNDRDYWTKSEWSHFCILQKMNFIGSIHKGSSSTLVTISDWDNRWFDCIIRQCSTFIIYFH